jgi:hypothetical protein
MHEMDRFLDGMGMLTKEQRETWLKEPPYEGLPDDDCSASEDSEQMELKDLIDYNSRRMLRRDNRNSYKLVGIIDYDSATSSYTAHVVKRNGVASWWYTHTEGETVRPHGGINTILQSLKAPHLLFYQRILTKKM